MLRNLWHHFLLITRHRHKVIAHCKKAGILWQGLRHDLSKYSPTEFIPGVKYYQGNRSPNEKEREILGYSLAWLHHKGRNRHHFEYWTDYNPVEKKVMPVKMPARFLVEMFCDRLAASKIYKGEQYTDQAPLEYFQNSTARKKRLPASRNRTAAHATTRDSCKRGRTSCFCDCPCPAESRKTTEEKGALTLCD